jgi:radical SAM-linked protein
MTGFTPPGGAGARPVIQRLIVRYAKRGRMRFASHRDIARAVERGVRRAGLPIAFSAGFTPHPRISYAGAAPTGTQSEAEYLELSLTKACAASEVRERLDAALPDGIDVIEVSEDLGPLGALPLEASLWQVILPGVTPRDAERAVEEFLACPSVHVERLTNKGLRRMDARAAVVAIETGWCAADVWQTTAARAARPPAAGGDSRRDADPVSQSAAPTSGDAILRMVVRHVTPAVRPDDILAALRRVAALMPSAPPQVTRLAQGALTADAEFSGSLAGFAPAAPGQAVLAAGTRSPAAPSGAPQAPGPEAATEQRQTTRPYGERTPSGTDTRPAGASNQLPRGADGRRTTFAPGSSTGECPDARQRAARQRARP